MLFFGLQFKLTTSLQVDMTLPNLSGGLYFSENGKSGYTDVLSYPLRLKELQRELFEAYPLFTSKSALFHASALQLTFQAYSWRLLSGASVTGGSLASNA